MEYLCPEKTGSKAQEQSVYFPETGYIDTKIIERQSIDTGERISGPAVLVEHGSTTLLGPGDRMVVDRSGSLIIEVG
jgi:N-methylhydantoinase A